MEKNFSYEDQYGATKAFGGKVAMRRLHLRRWDQLICETIPDIMEEGKWVANKIRNISLTHQRLVAFHAGAFSALQTLDLSKNWITSIRGSGLEQCINLWALNLDGNRLSDESELEVFGSIPMLRALYLTNNPFHDGRLASPFRYKVIYACRNVRGTNIERGLQYLDGHESSLDEKVEAMVYVTSMLGNADKIKKTKSCFFCCQNHSTNRTQEDANSVRASDQYRFSLLMESLYGSKAMSAKGVQKHRLLANAEERN